MDTFLMFKVKQFYGFFPPISTRKLPKLTHPQTANRIYLRIIQISNPDHFATLNKTFSDSYAITSRL